MVGILQISVWFLTMLTVLGGGIYGGYISYQLQHAPVEMTSLGQVTNLEVRGPGGLFGRTMTSLRTDSAVYQIDGAISAATPASAVLQTRRFGSHKRTELCVDAPAGDLSPQCGDVLSQ